MQQKKDKNVKQTQIHIWISYKKIFMLWVRTHRI